MVNRGVEGINCPSREDKAGSVAAFLKRPKGKANERCKAGGMRCTRQSYARLG